MSKKVFNSKENIAVKTLEILRKTRSNDQPLCNINGFHLINTKI